MYEKATPLPVESLLSHEVSVTLLDSVVSLKKRYVVERLRHPRPDLRGCWVWPQRICDAVRLADCRVRNGPEYLAPTGQWSRVEPLSRSSSAVAKATCKSTRLRKSSHGRSLGFGYIWYMKELSLSLSLSVSLFGLLTITLEELVMLGDNTYGQLGCTPSK